MLYYVTIIFFVIFHTLLPQDHLRHLNRNTLHKIPSAVTIQAVAIKVSLPYALHSFLKALMIAGSSHAEIGQDFVHCDDSLMKLTHL